MILEVFLIIIGFFLLIKGADYLVEGASKIAKKFYIPEIIIGLTIVSMGTSMPELFVSNTSALEGYSDIAIGNVLGSNICNLLLILGVSAIIRQIEFKKETRVIEIPAMLAITVIFSIFCNSNKIVDRVEASILIVMFIVFLCYTIWISVKEKNIKNSSIKENSGQAENINSMRNIVFVILGIIALKFGGDLVVENVKKVALLLNISEKIISVTIVALGTSLPELVTSVMAQVRGDSDIAVGNIIGSNIYNILFIVGVSGAITPISYSISYNFEIIILIISTILLGIFPMITPKGKMTKSNGFIYLFMYILYMIIITHNGNIPINI